MFLLQMLTNVSKEHMTALQTLLHVRTLWDHTAVLVILDTMEMVKQAVNHQVDFITISGTTYLQCRHLPNTEHVLQS